MSFRSKGACMTTMRVLKYAALLLTATALAFAGGQRSAFAANPAPTAGTTERPAHLRLLTGPGGGQWFTAGERLAAILTRDLAPTSNRIGGGVANITAVDKRLGDIAFTLTCFLGAAESGEQEYQSMAAANVALMANIYPQVLYFLLRKDIATRHGITDVAGLLKQRIPLRFASLKPGTASEFVLNMLFKYGYDTSFAKLREQGWVLEFGNYAETADNFVEGKLDCFAYTAGTEVPLILTMEQHTDVVVLPIDQKVLDLLAKKFKTSTYTIMPGLYKSITAPIATLGDSTCLIVRKDLQEDFVFEICKTIWNSKDSLVNAVKDFQSFSPESATPSGFDIHPGAKKFWGGVK
jgi:TRAP transporter TAXI family solute receptor